MLNSDSIWWYQMRLSILNTPNCGTLNTHFHSWLSRQCPGTGKALRAHHQVLSITREGQPTSSVPRQTLPGDHTEQKLLNDLPKPVHSGARASNCDAPDWWSKSCFQDLNISISNHKITLNNSYSVFPPAELHAALLWHQPPQLAGPPRGKDSVPRDGPTWDTSLEWAPQATCTSGSLATDLGAPLSLKIC